jgi:hypothetical protein
MRSARLLWVDRRALGNWPQTAFWENVRFDGSNLALARDPFVCLILTPVRGPRGSPPDPLLAKSPGPSSVRRGLNPI